MCLWKSVSVYIDLVRIRCTGAGVRHAWWLCLRCAFVWTGGKAMMCASAAGGDDLGFGLGFCWWWWCLIWAAEAPRLMIIRW